MAAGQATIEVSIKLVVDPQTRDARITLDPAEVTCKGRRGQ